MSDATKWLVLAVAIVVCATVAVCLHDLTATEWLGVVGSSGVLGGAGVHLSNSGSSA